MSIASTAINAGKAILKNVADNPGKAIATGGVVGAASAANMVMGGDKSPKNPNIGGYQNDFAEDNVQGGYYIVRLKKAPGVDPAEFDKQLRANGVEKVADGIYRTPVDNTHEMVKVFRWAEANTKGDK